MKHSFTFLLFALIYGSTIFATEAEDAHNASEASRFLGTWQLNSWTATTDSGEVIHPLGREAIGRITYGMDGSMSVHIMDPTVKRFKSDNLSLATAEEKENAWEKYFAYFGTYTVVAREGMVIHALEGCTIPNWTGTTQNRRYRFEKDSLILSAKTPDKITHRLVWRKAK